MLKLIVIISIIIKLSRADFDGNLNKDILTEWFGEDIKNNKVIQINDKNITSLHENTFEGLNELMRLDMSMNLLKDLPVKVFESLIELKTLHLDDNLIESVSSGIFNGIKKLENL